MTPQPESSPTEPHDHCSIDGKCMATARTGKRCTQPAVEGMRVCHYHGGASPQAIAARDRRLAEQRLALDMAKHGLTIPREVDPGVALLEVIYSEAGEVDYWRSVVAQIDPEALTWGVTQATTKKGRRKVTEAAGATAAYKLLVDAQSRLALHSSMALKAGIEERRVRLAEQQGQALAGVVSRILARMLDATLALLRSAGVDDAAVVEALRSGWSAAVAEVVPSEVRRLAGEGS